MRIGFITQWYDPEGGSAAIPGAMVRALEERGHCVDVVTGFPNYPHGKVYDGYRLRILWRERMGRTQVNRVALYPSHDRSPIRRTLNFLSFALSASSTGVALLRRSDVALVYSTPATVGLAGISLRRIFRRPFVLFVQDLWPDTVFATGMIPTLLTAPAERLLAAFCGNVYRAAARIAVISPGMKQILIERGIPEAKIDVVYNWVDEDIFCPLEPHSDPQQFTVMYAGSIGDVQGLEVGVEAIALLTDLPDVRLRLVGSGVAVQRLQRLAEATGVADRVQFDGPKDIRHMAELMASADLQLVCLRDLPLFHATMPSKIQAILACGQPAIVAAPGDVAELAVASGAGLAVEPGSAEALAQGIRQLYGRTRQDLRDMGQRGRDFYERELAADVGAARLEASLVTAVRHHRRRG